jgi:glycerophosphoryl diester phosphodiesterase
MPGLDWLIARPAAHRGLHDARNGAIENTASAFAAAIAKHYGIECDLQVSADGEAMVYHDATLDRLTEGGGTVAAMTAAELKHLPFKATADRMITLGELCELVAGRATLVVELKHQSGGDGRLVTRAANVLSKYRGPVAVMSFDPRQIAQVREAAPRLPRGLVAESRHHGRGTVPAAAWDTLTSLADALRARPQFIAYSVSDLPAMMPMLARKILRLPLLTWTVRSADERRKAELYADQIIFEGFRP